MRPIDADRMKEELLWGNAFLSAKEINALVDLIDNQPTLTPPNEWVSVEDRLPEVRKVLFVRAKRKGRRKRDRALELRAEKGRCGDEETGIIRMRSMSYSI